MRGSLVNNLLCSTAHILDPEFQGIILKQYHRAYSKAREQIKKIAAKYEGADQPHNDREQETSHQDINEKLSVSQRLKIVAKEVYVYDVIILLTTLLLQHCKKETAIIKC